MICRIHILSILLLAMLSGCQQGSANNLDNSVLPTRTQPIIDTATIVVPTEALSPTDISPTSTSPPLETEIPFGNFPTLAVDWESNIWIFALDSECSPVCWHNLQVGVSTQDDVKQTVLEIFGLHSSRPAYWKDTPFPQNTSWLGYGWVSDSIENNNIPTDVMEFGFSRDSLIHMYFETVWVESSTNDFITPQSLLERLGQPDWMYVKPLAGSPLYQASFVVAYKDGLFIEFSTDTDSTSYCLDENFDSGVARMSIGEPFSSIEELPLAYERYHWFVIEETKPIDEVLDASIEDIMAQVEAGQSVCFTAEVEN